MSESTSPLSVIKDPLLLNASRDLFGPAGRRLRNGSLLWATLSGMADGAALIVMLPITSSLSAGAPVWGLGVGSWLIVLAALAMVSAVARYRSSAQSYVSTLAFMRRAHSAIGDALASLPLGWFRPANTGGLSRLVSDGYMNAASAFAHVMCTVIANAASLLVILIGVWLWNPRLGLFLTIAAPIAVVVMIAAQSIRRTASSRVQPSDRELAGRIVEYATCQPALRAAGRSRDFVPLQQAAAVNDRARFKELWWSMIPLALNGIVVQAVVVSLITLAANLVVEGALGPIETIAFIGIVLRFTRILDDLGAEFVGIDMGRAPLSESSAILSAPRLSEPAAAEAASLTEPGRVDFDAVSFGYESGRPVVSDLSFTVAPGTMTALVGPSGSGKTTIARLISRFWDVDAGTVRVGGVDVRDQTTEQLMAQLSMVFQDVYLFDDSLAANIRVGRDGATAAEVRAAADLAGVTSIAERLPDGWASRVGEGGRSLSGGERQRVSIARALLKESPIVLFDEATSALDAENEANVLASVDKLRAQSTFIVIAHKLDTVRTADKIIVLDDHGRIAERGTHDELFARAGAYRAFWDRRASAEGWVLSAHQSDNAGF